MVPAIKHSASQLTQQKISLFTKRKARFSLKTARWLAPEKFFVVVVVLFFEKVSPELKGELSQAERGGGGDGNFRQGEYWEADNLCKRMWCRPGTAGGAVELRGGLLEGGWRSSPRSKQEPGLGQPRCQLETVNRRFWKVLKDLNKASDGMTTADKVRS